MSGEPLSHGMDLPPDESGLNQPQTNSEPDTTWTAPSSPRTVAASVDAVSDTTADNTSDNTSDTTADTTSEPRTISSQTTPSKLPAVETHDEAESQRPSIWIWRMEIAMCFLSLASFSVSIAVLRVYDGAKLITLPMNITLNAFLSFFTTLARAAFMVPIAEAMSQWKWNMYGSHGHSPNGWPMNDFNTLEQASRGTFGSFRLLLRYRWRHITVVGALVSIMGIATSPVTQQMISYPVLPSSNSELEGTQIRAPVARRFTYATYGVDGETHLSPVWSALRTTVGSTARYPVEDFGPPCPSGNCTFATYNSLAVCTTVADITDQLTVTRIANSSSREWTDNLDGWRDLITAPDGTTAYNASLPNGFNLVTPVSYASTQQVGMPTGTLGFKDHPNLSNFTALINVFLIYSAAGNVSYPGYDRTNEIDWSFRAFEILYHMCVNKYQTTVTSGRASTAVIASSYLPLPMENNLPLITPMCNVSDDVFGVVRCPLDYSSIPGYTYLADPDDPNGLHPENNFTIMRAPAMFLAQDLSQAMDFQNVMFDGGADSTKTTHGSRSDSTFEALYGYRFNITDPDEQRARISANANYTAIVLTNLMRTSEGNTSAAGTAWTLEPFIHVRWGFMAFFAVQLLFSYVFLAVTIYLTRRCHLPVVKSSALAAILASSEEMRARVGTIDKIQEAEKRAGFVKLRLEGGRFEIA